MDDAHTFHDGAGRDIAVDSKAKASDDASNRRTGHDASHCVGWLDEEVRDWSQEGHEEMVLFHRRWAERKQRREAEERCLDEDEAAGRDSFGQRVGEEERWMARHW